MNLTDYKEMQKRCSNCSYCKFIPLDKIKNARFSENCPASSYFLYNSYSARGRFELGRFINDGALSLNDPKTAEIIRNCLSCGASDISCKICRYNLEPQEHNLALKESSINAGNITREQKSTADALTHEGTTLINKKHKNRTAWVKELNLLDARKDECEVLFFPGCKYAYELPAKAYSAASIMIKSGVRVGYLFDDDHCCGGRILQMGMRKPFENAASKNIEAFNSAKIPCIVTPCADCFHALKRSYGDLGSNIKVYHITEYIEKLINEGKLKLKNPINAKVTYHDPCHLGRLGEDYTVWNGKEKKILAQIHTWDPPRPRYNGVHGVYDAPRNILKAIPGIELIEMDRIREYSWCCGSGGGCNIISEDFSEWTAKERISEAESTGASILVTACPYCTINLGKASDQIRVMDIIDLIQLSQQTGGNNDN